MKTFNRNRSDVLDFRTVNGWTWNACSPQCKQCSRHRVDLKKKKKNGSPNRRWSAEHGHSGLRTGSGNTEAVTKTFFGRNSHANVQAYASFYTTPTCRVHYIHCYGLWPSVVTLCRERRFVGACTVPVHIYGEPKWLANGGAMKIRVMHRRCA
jgi:hypothetical protein